MAKSPSRKERKKRLKERTNQNHAQKDNGGKTGRRALDCSKYPDVKFWKPEKSGKYSFDIVPYLIKTDKHPQADQGMEKGFEDYLLDIYVHRYIGPLEETFVCTKKTFGKPCPICDEQKRLKERGADEKITDALKPTHRCFYNVIPEGEDDVMLFECSHFLFEKELLEEAENSEDGVITFADIEDGMTISFRAKESSFSGNKFFKFKSFKFEEREPYDEDIFDRTYPLDEMLAITSYEDILDAMKGNFEEEEDDEEEDDEVEVKKPARKTKAKKVEPDEEEDDEDDEDDEDEEEVKKPARKTKAKAKTKKVEKKTKSKCPHGHKFGEEVDDFDECEDCKCWEKCMEAFEDDE